MALTLDANLAARLNEQSRRPLVEIISLPSVADIPFGGQFLTGETLDEQDPAIIAHSSGRLIIPLVYNNDTAPSIHYTYTDTGRQTFTTLNIGESGIDGIFIDDISGMSVCEMSDGNVGLLYITREYSTAYHLVRRIVTPTGTLVSRAIIGSWAVALGQAGAWVITVATNSYLAVYGRIESGTPNHYHLYKRTSADFVTWSAESELSIAGLDATKSVENPSILKISTGDLWLFFDYCESMGGNNEELRNIYYSVSSNGGATWGAAVKATNYTTYSATGIHPVGIQKAANQITLLFTLKLSSLLMDHDTPGWTADDNGAPQFLMFDAVNRKLYACVSGTYVDRDIDAVVKIDIDTWTVDKAWSKASVPALDNELDYVTQGRCQRSEYPYFGILSVAGDVNMLDVINVADDTVTHYYFEDNVPLGISCNVPANPTRTPAKHIANVNAFYIDASTNRIYFAATGEYATGNHFELGYIDLLETGPEYSWNYLIYEEQKINSLIAIDAGFTLQLIVSNEDDLFFFSGYLGDESWGGGFLRIYTLSTFALYKHYNYSTTPEFPTTGLRSVYYKDGVVWGGFVYQADYGQGDYRGLCKLELASDNITYFRPTYASIDDYDFRDIREGPSGKLVIAHLGYGVALFEMSSGVWELFSPTNIPGMTGQFNEKTFHDVIYDSVGGNIIFAQGYSTFENEKCIGMFSQYGAFQQANYQIGTDPGGGWTFASADPLVMGYHDHEAVAALDPDDSSSMFVFWRNENPGGTEYSIKWDKDGSELDLGSFIVVDETISTEESIDGRPARLTFTVSHAHLFDPYNKDSLFSIYLKKFRKLTLRWGEMISGTPYYQAAGTFFVSEMSMSAFEREKYPTARVVAEDRRILWMNHHIYATAYYEDLPEDIIEGLLMAEASTLEADIDLPVFTGGTTIEHQWMDTTLDEIINQVCNRFGYFFRYNVLDKATARLISITNSIDHTYADNTKLFSYSPDDRYSDSTNRVTVQGQERSFTDITFPEERVGGISGTVGWWGYKNSFQIWFSEDRSRRCKNPRLEIIETATSIGFQIAAAGGIHESLTEDTEPGYEYKYCTVWVTAPNLTGPLLAAVMMYLGFSWAIGNYAPPTGGLTVSIGRWIEKALLIIVFMILGSCGNFQYQIYAQPMGSLRRSVQATANDEENQTLTGIVNEKKIEDPLCYTATECATVAEFELLVARMQRRRLKISKMAHLQDEAGDTIRFVHPYSGKNIDIFVTGITRTLLLSERSGYFKDDLDGWVITD